LILLLVLSRKYLRSYKCVTKSHKSQITFSKWIKPNEYILNPLVKGKDNIGILIEISWVPLYTCGTRKIILGGLKLKFKNFECKK